MRCAKVANILELAVFKFENFTYAELSLKFQEWIIIRNTHYIIGETHEHRDTNILF